MFSYLLRSSCWIEDLNLNEWHSYENAAFVLFSEGYVKDWIRFADPTGSSRLETTGRTKGQFNQEKVANEHANHAKIIDLQYKNTSYALQEAKLLQQFP